jgi:hypothetical protein
VSEFLPSIAGQTLTKQETKIGDIERLKFLIQKKIQRGEEELLNSEKVFGQFSESFKHVNSHIQGSFTRNRGAIDQKSYCFNKEITQNFQDAKDLFTYEKNSLITEIKDDTQILNAIRSGTPQWPPRGYNTLLKSLSEDNSLSNQDCPNLELLKNYGPQSPTPSSPTNTPQATPQETFTKTIEKMNQYESRASFYPAQNTPLQFFEKKTPSRTPDAEETL